MAILYCDKELEHGRRSLAKRYYPVFLHCTRYPGIFTFNPTGSGTFLLYPTVWHFPLGHQTFPFCSRVLHTYSSDPNVSDLYLNSSELQISLLLWWPYTRRLWGLGGWLRCWACGFKLVPLTDLWIHKHAISYSCHHRWAKTTTTSLPQWTVPSQTKCQNKSFLSKVFCQVSEIPRWSKQKEKHSHYVL